MEKWVEIRARHRREKIELLQTLAQSGYSYRTSASILGMNKEALATAAKHYGVSFEKHKSNERRVRYANE